MKKIVVFTGSGISAESGINTFRDSGGLWEKYDIAEVATPEAWASNPELVQRFYNDRRKQILETNPNDAHFALAALEKSFDVTVITQNIDNLHERAGSTKVIHLHGEITKARSSIDAELVYDIDGWELKSTNLCEKGTPLRPNIVWFGEPVPMMIPAMREVSIAEIFVVIGTSLEVYPAAGLLEYAPTDIPKYYVDPLAHERVNIRNLTIIKSKAGVAIPQLVQQLMSI